jgi:phenylalanyl-tRNA synthetase beta chain
MNPETKYLVPYVLIKYVSSAAENLHSFDTVRIFGIQKSFPGSAVKERKDLILALAQKGSSAGEEFYQLKGIIDALLESLGISGYWYDDQIESRIPGRAGKNQESRIYHPYRFAEVKIGDEKIGMLGEIHPSVLENIKARGRIVAAEIDMEKLARLATTESEFRPVGKYPAIIRDLAVVVPQETKTEEVTNVIENIGGTLLADTDLFDYFQDDEMREAAEKSLAFHLVFQFPERTLTDAEIDPIIKKITSALEENGWEVRK